jgi:histidine triad (HIT) family protein
MRGILPVRRSPDLIRRKLLFRLARSRLSRLFIREAFTYMSFAIPVKRLRETETLMAFYHPQPSHAVHILLVPKRPFSSLLDVPPDDADFLRDLFETVQSLVREFNLGQSGYRLVANGGAYQDVPHLHFHLVADTTATSDIGPQT